MSVPVHLGDWTWEDLQGLPEGARYEVVDGSLVVSPPPSPRHEYVVAELQALLRAAVPPELVVLGSVGVQLGRTLRAPDVVVARRRALDVRRTVLLPEDVALVVEVVSPSSTTTDRVTKRQEYAALPGSWLLDPDLPLLAVHEGSREVLRVEGDEVARLGEPFPVRVVPSALLP